jgi:hypothetical protein
MQAGAGFCVGITVRLTPQNSSVFILTKAQAMLNQGFSASQQRNTEVAAGVRFALLHVGS